jgi:predicted nucleic-acid-binding Zn-ribbon protein
MVSKTCPKCGSSDYRDENIMRQNSCNGTYEVVDVYNACNTCHHKWFDPQGVD